MEGRRPTTDISKGAVVKLRLETHALGELFFIHKIRPNHLSFIKTLKCGPNRANCNKTFRT